MLTNLTGNKPKVLVVDDVAAYRFQITRMLRGWGYETCEAANGQLALITYLEAKPDIVLMDGVMPKMDGFTACAQLREMSDGRAVVIMVTSLDDNESVERAFASGAADYITKPIHFTLLKKRLERIWEAALGRASEANFCNLVAKSVNGIIVLAEDGVVLYANSAAEEEVFRQKRGSLNGEFLVPLAELKQEKLLKIIGPTGEERTAETRIVDFFWAGRVAYLVLLHDITDRLRLEEALQRVNLGLEEQVRDRTADLLAVNARLRTEIAEKNHAYDATLQGWSRALDLRDKETEGHSYRVTEMTLRLARRLGYSGDILVHVWRGALLHDVGKLGIPDQILLKPGPLDAEERSVIQRHPQYAYDMIMPIRFLKPAVDIPYCHHEKWDGTGYPRRLQGEAIPRVARLFAVVDVWDALSSNRPYRDSWPRDKICRYIAAESNRHFDPEVVREFLAMVKEGAVADSSGDAMDVRRLLQDF